MAASAYTMHMPVVKMKKQRKKQGPMTFEEASRRKSITCEIFSYDCYLYHKFETLDKMFNHMKTETKKELNQFIKNSPYQWFGFKFEHHYGTTTVTATRDETDQEVAKRIKSWERRQNTVRKNQQKKEEKEKILFEQLKKKYETKTTILK